MIESLKRQVAALREQDNNNRAVQIKYKHKLKHKQELMETAFEGISNLLNHLLAEPELGKSREHRQISKTMAKDLIEQNRFFKNKFDEGLEKLK